MTNDQIAQLIYLMLLLCAVGGSVLLSTRANGGTKARHLATWGLIFVGVIAAFGLWSDIRSTVLPRQEVFEDENRIEVPRGNDGHFHLVLEVDGTRLPFIVDTGASNVVLSRKDAQRLGIDPETLVFAGEAATANGTVRTARVTLENVRLGHLEDRRLTAWVNDGELHSSLLGMDYLRRFQRIEMLPDRLILTR